MMTFDTQTLLTKGQGNWEATTLTAVVTLSTEIWYKDDLLSN